MGRRPVGCELFHFNKNPRSGIDMVYCDREVLHLGKSPRLIRRRLLDVPLLYGTPPSGDSCHLVIALVSVIGDRTMTSDR
jgi:hypothetical protein